MRKKIRTFIYKSFIGLLNFFYPLFKKWFSKEIYYYLACGTINTLSDWVLYFITYHFIVQKRVLDLGYIAFKPHILSLIIVTPITFIIGFNFSKHITFRYSKLETYKQIFRYSLVLLNNFVLSYCFLKLFVDILGLYPTPSKMIITVITTVVGYFMQKYYTFTIKNARKNSI